MSNRIRTFLNYIRTLKTYKVDRFYNDSNDPSWITHSDGRVEAPIERSHVFTSETKYWPGHHDVVLDIDLEAWLYPSTTNNHLVVRLPQPIPWEKYEKFLQAAADIGLIEEGYYKASVARKHTALRLPWVDKRQINPDGTTQPPPSIPGEFLA